MRSLPSATQSRGRFFSYSPTPRICGAWIHHRVAREIQRSASDRRAAEARRETSRFRTQLGLVGRVLNAETRREDQCVAEDGQPAALSALLIRRPSGGESFVKGASPSTPTRAHTRSSSSRGIHHPGRYSMQTSSSRFARCNFRARYCH